MKFIIDSNFVPISLLATAGDGRTYEIEIHLISVLFSSPEHNYAGIQETETFLKYLQIEKTPSVHKAFKDNEAFLWIPSVVMLLIACRGFVFWCLNVVLFNCVAINGKTIAKNAEKIGRSQTRSNYNGSTFSEVNK